jgi:hypothetical protein
VKGAKAKKAAGNPMNKLVPYLDLFGRLEDEELSRLARVPLSVVTGLRQQVDQVAGALERYSDLLPRLDDGEFVRLTGANPKTIRFWRLSQARSGASAGDAPVASESGSRLERRDRAADSGTRMERGVRAPAAAAGVPERRAASVTPSPSAEPRPMPRTDSGAVPTAQPMRPTPAPREVPPQESGPMPGVAAAASAGAVASAMATQSSASMLLEDVGGEPFPGFESNSAPRGQDPVMEDIEIGMFEEDEDEEDPLGDELSLADDGDFF